MVLPFRLVDDVFCQTLAAQYCHQYRLQSPTCPTVSLLHLSRRGGLDLVGHDRTILVVTSRGIMGNDHSSCFPVLQTVLRTVGSAMIITSPHVKLGGHPVDRSSANNLQDSDVIAVFTTVKRG